MNPTTTTQTTTEAESFTVGLSTTEDETIITLSADLLTLDEADELIEALRAAVAKARSI